MPPRRTQTPMQREAPLPTGQPPVCPPFCAIPCRRRVPIRVNAATSQTILSSAVRPPKVYAVLAEGPLPRNGMLPGQLSRNILKIPFLPKEALIITR